MHRNQAIEATSRHLGGHGNTTHVDAGALDYLVETFVVRTMLDLGCATGGMVKLARSRGVFAVGVDGDPNLDPQPEFTWDFSKGPMGTEELGGFDLVWCIEFVEHVEQRFMSNYLSAMRESRVVMLTHAPPGTPGQHHVNCQLAEYWVDVFKSVNFMLDHETTREVRRRSTMNRNFV